jgi:hypothetical protein
MKEKKKREQYRFLYIHSVAPELLKFFSVLAE